ncbi:MAG: hypothetical protein ABH878_09175 [bacterium]
MSISESEARSPYLPADTTLEAFHVQIEVLRRIGAQQRAKMTGELCANLRELLASGVRMRHPEYNEQDVKWAVSRLIVGEKLFRCVFPEVKIKP